MVYIFYFLIIILLCIGAGNKRSNIYLIISLGILWLIMGLRTTEVGADTLGYVADFDSMHNFSFNMAFKRAFTSREPLYWLTTWLCSLFSNNYSLYLMVWSLFPIVSLYITYKNELKTIEDYLIAIIVFFLLGLFAFYVAGIRQTVALSIALVSYKYIKKKKLVKFLLCIGLAYLFHNSAVLFLVAYPLSYLPFRWWYIAASPIAIFMGYFVNIDVIVNTSFAMFDERFAYYGTVYESSQNTSAFIMQIILLLINVPNYKKLTEQDPINAFLFIMCFLGLLIQSLSGKIAEMARISFYFCMFEMILVPRSLQIFSAKRKLKGIHTLFVIVCLIYLFFLTSSNLPKYSSVLF